MSDKHDNATRAAEDSSQPWSKLSCAGQSFRAAWTTLALSLLAAVLMIVSSLIIKQEPSEPVKVLAAALPIPAFLAMFWVMVRAARRLDELHIRVQLEALAATVIAVSMIVVACGQFQRIHYLPSMELWTAWPIIAFTYPVCYAFAWWRYR